MAGPFTIETSYPAATDVQSAFPAHETQFRQTVWDWLNVFSDPTDGSLLPGAFATFIDTANTWTAKQTFENVAISGAVDALAVTGNASVGGTLAVTGAVTLTVPLAIGQGGTGSTTAAAARTAFGLGSAALSATTDFATAAQGATADAAMPKTGGTFSGAVTMGGVLTANSNIVLAGSFYTSQVNLIMGNNGGSGAIYLRPNGVSSGTGQFYVATGGAVVASGTITAPQVTYSSDSRLKSSIKPMWGALDKVRRLSGYLYHRDDLDVDSAGLIAQEVQAVLPEAVRTNDDGYLSVDPGAVIGLLVAAIKELSDDASI